MDLGKKSSDEKFFENTVDRSLINPIIQEYKSQLQAIDFKILKQSLDHQYLGESMIILKDGESTLSSDNST